MNNQFNKSFLTKMAESLANEFKESPFYYDLTQAIKRNNNTFEMDLLDEYINEFLEYEDDLEINYSFFLDDSEFMKLLMNNLNLDVMKNADTLNQSYDILAQLMQHGYNKHLKMDFSRSLDNTISNVKDTISKIIDNPKYQIYNETNTNSFEQIKHQNTESIGKLNVMLNILSSNKDKIKNSQLVEYNELVDKMNDLYVSYIKFTSVIYSNHTHLQQIKNILIIEDKLKVIDEITEYLHLKPLLMLNLNQYIDVENKAIELSNKSSELVSEVLLFLIKWKL